MVGGYRTRVQSSARMPRNTKVDDLWGLSTAAAAAACSRQPGQAQPPGEGPWRRSNQRRQRRHEARQEQQR